MIQDRSTRGSTRKTIITIIAFWSTIVACVLAAEESLPTQDFPIVELQYKDNTEYFYLYSDYGFIAQWKDDETPQFFLYDTVQNRISVTDDLPVFLKGLSGVPEGAEVAWINTCSAPLHYGMPPEMLSQIHDVLKKKAFNMAGIDENNFVLCACETTNMVFFTQVPGKPKDDVNK